MIRSPLSYWLLRKFHAPRIVHARTPEDFGLKAVTVRIKAIDGGSLFGWWIPGTNQSSAQKRTTAIVLHGWGANASLMLDIALWIVRLGFNGLFIDARSHGLSSEADFMSMPRFAEDLESARVWAVAREDVNPLEVIAIGHSVGAGAALLSASRTQWAGVVSLSAFAHPKDMMHRYMDEHKIPRPWIQPWIINQVQAIIGARFDEIAPANTVKKIQCPILLVHGKEDKDVPVSEAQLLFQEAPKGTRSIILDETGHDLRPAILSLGPAVISFLENIVCEHKHCNEVSQNKIPRQVNILPGDFSCSD